MVKHVLFICSQNRLRSPTAEQIFATRSDIEVDSAGTNHDAIDPITPELLRWADLTIVMEPTHREKLQKRFRASLNGKRVICLGIRDDYAFMDPALIQLLNTKVPALLGSPPTQTRPIEHQAKFANPRRRWLA